MFLQGEFEVFWIVQSRGTQAKLGALLKFCLFAWDIDVFWITIWGTNPKQPGKLGILVKIYMGYGIPFWYLLAS